MAINAEAVCFSLLSCALGFDLGGIRCMDGTLLRGAVCFAAQCSWTQAPLQAL